MPQRHYQVQPSMGSALLGLLVVGLFFYLLFRVAAFTVNTLLSGLPIFFGLGALLFLGAYLINKQVPQSFVQWLGATVRTSPAKGILLGAATVVFAPFVGAYLLGKAVLVKRIREVVDRTQQQAAEHMRHQAGGASIGVDDTAFEEVRRDDGLVIRIPKEEGE